MTVRMTHPNLPDQPIEVPPDAVSGHRRAGWLTDEDLEKQVEAAPPTRVASTRRTEFPAASTGKE